MEKNMKLDVEIQNIEHIKERRYKIYLSELDLRIFSG
jgi:hypothetical protein